MKKLIYTIIIPLTMVCCQSENDSQELEETTPVKKETDCLSATVVDGKVTSVQDYWNDIPGIDGYVYPISNSTRFDYYCFNTSEYTYEQMEEIVRSKY